MMVVKQHEITNSMYVIHAGKVLEFNEDDRNGSKVHHTGDIFGLFQGLQKNVPFTNTYKTMIKSQILTLSFTSWEFLLNHFPDSYNRIYKHFPSEGDNLPTFYNEMESDDINCHKKVATPLHSTHTIKPSISNIFAVDDKKSLDLETSEPIAGPSGLSGLLRKSKLKPPEEVKLHLKTTDQISKKKQTETEAEVAQMEVDDDDLMNAGKLIKRVSQVAKKFVTSNLTFDEEETVDVDKALKEFEPEELEPTSNKRTNQNLDPKSSLSLADLSKRYDSEKNVEEYLDKKYSNKPKRKTVNTEPTMYSIIRDYLFQGRHGSLQIGDVELASTSKAADNEGDTIPLETLSRDDPANNETESTENIDTVTNQPNKSRE